MAALSRSSIIFPAEKREISLNRKVITYNIGTCATSFGDGTKNGKKFIVKHSILAILAVKAQNSNILFFNTYILSSKGDPDDYLRYFLLFNETAYCGIPLESNR